MVWYFIKLVLTSLAFPWPAKLKRSIFPELGHGLNLSNASKETPDFLPPCSDYDKLAPDHKHVRLLTFWEAVEPRAGEYDEEYLAALKEELKELQRRGKRVILDVHQDLFGRRFGGDGWPEWTRIFNEPYKPVHPWNFRYFQEAVENNYRFWWYGGDQEKYVAMLDKLLSVTDGLIYGIDVMNEPWGGYNDRFEQDSLTPFYDAIKRMILAKGYKARLIVEPMMYTSVGCLSSKLRGEYDIVSFHCYDPWIYAGLPYCFLNRWYARYVLSNFTRQANRMGAALWIGEYSGPEEYRKWLQEECICRGIPACFYQ